MKAPEFTLASIYDNGNVSLNDYHGTPLLITFWVSWCPDCQRDIPMKDHLYKSMDKDRLKMLLINVSGREYDQKNALTYYEKEKISIPSLQDIGTKVYDAYQCMSVPTTFLLNKEHNIVARFNDKSTFQNIVKELGKVL
ncbi:TlpA disulfide reductase family protein [Evansella tamaricis]|uniref:TlpA family protein disulfide reductase n=1 Tax=Evansella tamaricis TaxID=2069301 RepID=A0ABS6JLU3_9BACI|nr:TlpA disulfide reductase family protein [Evansella tamaricis]MBU9714647.1 TlpA family protein disulfide reductase [Evansella tamaricis]